MADHEKVNQIVVYVRRHPDDILQGPLGKLVPDSVRRALSWLSEEKGTSIGPGPSYMPMTSEQVERITKEETIPRYKARDGHVYSRRAVAVNSQERR